MTSIENSYGHPLERFHASLANLRAHPTTFTLEPYNGCSQGCTYCMYNQETNQQKKPSVSHRDMEELREFLMQSDHRFITSIGHSCDSYQPLERRLEVTRNILKVFNSCNFPVLLFTRMQGVLRDADILEEMGNKGLVEVVSTLISLDEGVRYHLERRSPTAEQRLHVVRELARRGIPASFHLTPHIAGLNDEKQLGSLLRHFQNAGAKRVYFSLLGITSSIESKLLQALKAINPLVEKNLMKSYWDIENCGFYQVSESLLIEEHEKARSICEDAGLEFFSEQIPVFSKGNGHEGIYRFKLPIIADFCTYFQERKKRFIVWEDLMEYLSHFDTVNKEYIGKVREYWDTAQLFKNTFYHPICQGENICYSQQDHLDLTKFTLPRRE
ncbi:radical SAM protein [Candidatus Woesearchaeota archaeon]|nr:radical SAM protein [Candidatus Woesearchaeota archaeon]